MKSVYPRTKINLVERPEWKAYDPADKLGHTILDNADSLMHTLYQDGLGTFAEKVLGSDLSEEEKFHLWQEWRSDDPRLEEFRHMLSDSAMWSMEAAFVPRDEDIKLAIERALEELPQDDVAWLEDFQFQSLQDIMMSASVENPPEIVKGLLSGIASLERKKGHYDRFLVYDPEGSPLLQYLKAIPLKTTESGVLDWIPRTRMYNDAIDKDLRRFYGMMKEHVVERVFRELGKRMGSVDYDARVDFWEMVKHRVALDPKERKRVQKDLRRVLAESSANLGANPFFASSPRARRLAKDFAEMEELVRESSILEIKKTEGDPPDRYVIVFKGGGLSPEGKVKENHEVRLDLGVNYPTALPSIHWLTPIKHPNISGGNPCLGNIGMNPRIRLVDIVEVLWDMNRLAIYSPSAEQWKEYAKYRLPVDERILRDKAPRPPAEEGGEDLIILGRW